MHTNNLKPGDFVIYRTPHSSDIGVVLSRPNPGGTLKALNTRGKVVWYVTSGCEVIVEKRQKTKSWRFHHGESSRVHASDTAASTGIDLQD